MTTKASRGLLGKAATFIAGVFGSTEAADDEFAQAGDQMKLIVGLGNPGRKYEDTRHNVGFGAIVELARRHGDGSVKTKFQSEVAEVRIGSEKVLLLCPQTYMNKSGASVLAARDFFKLELANLLVICDDFNLPLAKLRVRAKGSSGGQRGLENILQRLGNPNFARLRIGIGAPPPQWNVPDYVLSKFTEEEIPQIQEAIRRAADAAECWATDGIDQSMNRYNASGGIQE